MALNQEQRIVRNGISVSLLVTLGLGYLFYFVARWTLPHGQDLTQKWFFTLKWLIWPVFTLWIGILVCAAQRFFSKSIDPILDFKSQSLKVNCQYVENTTQQLLLLFFSVILIATYLPNRQLALIPTICLIFTIGRITFWVGYHFRASYRAFGMFMTELATIAPMMYLTGRVLIVNFIR